MSNRSVQVGNFNAMAPNPPPRVPTATWAPPRNALRNNAVKLIVNFQVDAAGWLPAVLMLARLGGFFLPPPHG